MTDNEIERLALFVAGLFFGIGVRMAWGLLRDMSDREDRDD